MLSSIGFHFFHCEGGFHSIPTGAGLLYPPPPQGAMLQEVPFLMIDLASHLIVVFRAFNKTKNHPILLGAHYLPRPTSRHILWGSLALYVLY